MSRLKHLPTPWKHEYRSNTGTMIFSGDKPVISVNSGLGYPVEKGDIEFILRACNNFDDLFAACERLIRNYDEGRPISGAIRQIKDVIAKVKEQQ